MALIGVDTGGTFTDFIMDEDGELRILKLLSTPDNPARAVIEGLAQLGLRAGDAGTVTGVVHGSTVATNAILERKGVPTALVTNQGFTDVLEIGRQHRLELYDLHYRRPPALVERGLRFGVPGRFSSEGEEVEPFDDAAAAEVARAIRASGVESVAVCLLFSFLNPAHERRMATILAEHCPDVAVSLSHEILAEFREFERTSTTVVNGYVAPRMKRYLSELSEAIPCPLRIMQSNGGSISAATAMREPVRTILSGPAGGVVGALELGRRAGHDRLMTFDMGGTSSDVALMDRTLPLTSGTELSGFPVKTPMLDIHTVGAGGGSIAAMDAGGALTVGPESAGADPGPVCYGKGERITVTDANLYLGRLVPGRFLGGNMALDEARLAGRMEDMAKDAGLSPLELAEGIVQVADSNMERALRVISVERGYDPRDFTLFSFGGAGGLHCASLARLLGMRRVLVPPSPGILSAMGMLLADVVKDFSRTVMLDAAAVTGADLDELFAPLEAQAQAAMDEEGSFENTALARALDMRYQGQSFELLVPLESNDEQPAARFEALHEQQYGHRNQGVGVQIVNLRLRATGSGPKPDATGLGDRGAAPVAVEGHTSVWNGQCMPTKVRERSELRPGENVPGPAIITEYSSTIVVPPDMSCAMDSHGNLFIQVSD